MTGEDGDAKKKAEAAELYKQLHQEEMAKNGGDTAAAAASAIVLLKEKMAVTSAGPPATTEENENLQNGHQTNGVEAANGAAGSPTAAELRERRLQALEEAQGQKKQTMQTVPGTTFSRGQSNAGATVSQHETTPGDGGHSQPAQTASAAELRERRLQALENSQKQKATELASHQTSSGGFRKRAWDSVNVLNNTPAKIGEALDNAEQPQEEKVPELPSNLTGVVLAPQGFDPPPRTNSECASTNGSSIVGGVIVKRSVSGTDDAVPEPMGQDDEGDEELRQALAMSMDDGMKESKTTTSMPPTPTAQKRKVATEPEDLEALAQRLEKGDSPNLEDVSAAAESLRETAKKIRQLEATAMHFAQTLQVVQMVVSRSGLPSLGGEAEGPGLGASPPSPFARMAQPEENTKSYLFKRGEQRDEEPDQAQATRTISFVGSTGTASSPTNSNDTPTNGLMTCGGSGSAGQAISREEMDKQRNERLQRLESQQADAKREKEAMEAKQRAREAMFTAEGPKKR